jgi:hypothetical protein
MKTITITLDIADDPDPGYAVHPIRRAVKHDPAADVLSRVSQLLRPAYAEGRQNDLEMLLLDIAAKITEAEAALDAEPV